MVKLAGGKGANNVGGTRVLRSDGEMRISKMR